MAKKIEVWHVRDEHLRGLRGDDVAPAFPEGYRQVAVVESAASAEDAYRLTNSIHCGWWEHAQVRSLVGPCRSTSVGDVVVVGGVPMICDRVGFSALGDREGHPVPLPLW